MSSAVRVAPARRGPDAVMCKLLFIPPTSVGREPYRLFSTSMVISGLRCLLGYVVFPIISPALGAATGVGPAIGIPLGVLALVFDVRGIRRFFLSNHRLRWPITAIYLVVIGLVMSLLVGDISKLA